MPLDISRLRPPLIEQEYHLGPCRIESRPAVLQNGLFKRGVLAPDIIGSNHLRRPEYGPDFAIQRIEHRGCKLFRIHRVRSLPLAILILDKYENRQMPR